jgi:hypothetical protein
VGGEAAARRIEFDFDLVGDRPGYVILYGENIAHVALVAVRPEMRLVARADELRGDAHAPA